MHRRRSTTARALLAISLACVGCASLRDPVPPRFEKIALEAEVARDPQGRLEGDLSAHSTFAGSMIGGSIGAAVGAIIGPFAGLGIGLLACGDDWEAFACVTAGVLLGVPGGALAGFGPGALAGGLAGLPSETTEAVNGHLRQIEHVRRVEEDLLDALRAAVPQAKQADAADAGATVTARFDEFDLRQHLGDRISLRFDASMVQRWHTPGGVPGENTCEYRYTSERRDAEAWLADDGAAFRKTLEEGIWTMARWMARDLEAFAAQKELPATATEPRSCFRERLW